MSSPTEDQGGTAAGEDDRAPGRTTDQERAARHQGLLADLDLLPETTSDEAGGHHGRSDDDYRADRPPHHGD